MKKEKIINEAFVALVKEKNQRIREISLQNDFYFDLWTNLIDYVYEKHGTEGVHEATKKLKNEYKEKLDTYIKENY